MFALVETLTGTAAPASLLVRRDMEIVTETLTVMDTSYVDQITVVGTSEDLKLIAELIAVKPSYIIYCHKDLVLNSQLFLKVLRYSEIY